VSKSNITDNLKAEFKEVARNIVSKDRNARKSGHSNNTINDIERALVKAFRLGQEYISFDDSHSSPVVNDIIDWIEIPPRSRRTLADLTTCFSRIYGRCREKPSHIERVISEKGCVWNIIHCEDVREQRHIANGSVAPLIRMRLLAPSAENAEIFSVTELGIKTSKVYWHRSDLNDPTLPKIQIG